MFLNAGRGEDVRRRLLVALIFVVVYVLLIVFFLDIPVAKELAYLGVLSGRLEGEKGLAFFLFLFFPILAGVFAAWLFNRREREKKH